MKRLPATLIVLGLISFFTSCNNDDPVACFAIPSRLETNEEYTFKDCSINVQEYNWDFGDGRTSQLPSPIHIYPDEGTYTVTLRGKNKKKTDELVRTISTWKNDLTGASAGVYSGYFIEQYVDSMELDKEYPGDVIISPLSTKEIEVFFSRGSFRAQVVGQMDTGFVFTEVSNLKPARLELISSGTGSFSRKTNTFSFKLTGQDPNVGSLLWAINYSGIKK